MTPEQYERLTELFHAAVEVTPGQRDAFLNQACDGDADLRRELESLLAVQDAAFTETPPDDIAAGYLAQQGVNSAGAPSLAPNTRVDRYEIHSLLGTGGMGEVYLAEDMRLHRKVALKILPSKFASNQDRMRRFEQEAQAAAALNHPNIAHVYEIGESENTHFIAIEYIDGQTLRERIHRDKDPLPNVLKYLIQVAEGLAKAHAAGIVHRDLKPDNIMITRDGYAKILDFGLAKLIESESTLGEQRRVSNQNETIDLSHHSMAGMVMGTAGYMSPEQAQGKVAEIDQRSDIFSFGCILFEGVTGQKAFPDDSVIKSLSRTGYETAPLIKDYDSAVPPDLERIVRRCLARDRGQRYQTIRDVGAELKEVRQRLPGAAEFETTLASAGDSFRGQPTATTSRPHYVVSSIIQHQSRALIAVIAAVLAIIALAWFLPRRSGTRRPIPPPITVKRLTPDINALGPTLSPNGEYLGYIRLEKGVSSLWLQDMATGNSVQTMPPSAEGYACLQFSPDGQEMYYLTSHPGTPNATIVRIPVKGGIAKDIASNAMGMFAVSPDGKQVGFFRDRSIVIASTETKRERNLITLPAEYGAFVMWGSQLSWSPDGARIAACALKFVQGKEKPKLIDVSVIEGTRRDVPTPDWAELDDAVWMADGASLLVTAREKEGEPQQIWRVGYPNGETSRITNDSNNYDGISLTADSRTLVAQQGFARQNIWLAPLANPNGAIQLTTSALAADGYSGIAFAPDDAIVFTSPRSGNVDLWKMNADGSNQHQLTSNAGNYNAKPRITPDGRYIVFVSSRTGTKHIWRMDVDGQNPLRLTYGTGTEDYPSLSPDGKWIYYSLFGEQKPSIWKVSIDGGESVSTNVLAWDVLPSPDGKLLACDGYIDDPKRPFNVAITSSDGGEPQKLLDIPAYHLTKRWTNDSKSLIYIKGSAPELWKQPIDGSPPVKIFALSSERLYSFVISPDFLKVAYSFGNESTEAVLISNFAPN